MSALPCDMPGAHQLPEEEKGEYLLIVVMTAHAMCEDQEMCLAAGMDGYITKPFHSPSWSPPCMN